ncbi:MAG: PEGA domain-containing protein [Deltaproteobacteria bacterium]|nr:PEGA domain-containing protein [Deltaproteobacteria bacterium]
MAFEKLNAERDLPSVIINMPELRRMDARKRALHVFIWSVAGLVFIALAGLIYLELAVRPKETVSAETLEVKKEDKGSLKLTVKFVPERVAGAVVEVDGKVISGSPPYVYVPPGEDYHSIRIRVPGYRNMNRDVQLNESEVVTFTLIPDPSAQMAMADNDAAQDDDADEIGDSEEFAANSDDLIEEIDEANGVLVAEATHQKKKEKQAAEKALKAASTRSEGNAKAGKANQEAIAVKTKKTTGTATTGTETSPGKRVASTNSAISGDAGDGKAGTAEADDAGASPLPSPSIPVSQLTRPPRASLVINAPPGVSSRVAVHVNGQMRGYLPVLLKIDAGLHELIFIVDGNRTFQMVKVNAGEIVRIVPKL